MSGSTPTPWTAPATLALIESLKADYDAGRLPSEAVERFDALREEFYQSLNQNLGQLASDLQPIVEQVGNALRDAMQSVTSAGDEAIRPGDVPIVMQATDTAVSEVLEPILDASVDVARNALDVAADLAELRAQFDPTGEFTDRLRDSRAELLDGRAQFEDSVDAMHDRFDQLHDDLHRAAEQVTDPANQHGADAASPDTGQDLHVIRTTVDPDLPEQIEHNTGQLDA